MSHGFHFFFIVKEEAVVRRCHMDFIFFNRKIRNCCQTMSHGLHFFSCRKRRGCCQTMSHGFHFFLIAKEEVVVKRCHMDFIFFYRKRRGCCQTISHRFHFFFLFMLCTQRSGFKLRLCSGYLLLCIIAGSNRGYVPVICRYMSSLDQVAVMSRLSVIMYRHWIESRLCSCYLPLCIAKQSSAKEETVVRRCHMDFIFFYRKRRDYCQTMSQ